MEGLTAGRIVQLQVFTDGANDELDNVVWRTSVLPDLGSAPKSYTWHWPERA